MVANYFQTLNWRENPVLLKTIISYYTKAKAYESLGAFYETCADIEIEDFKNYQKVSIGS
jgi:intraflagellar transport protein 140